MGQILIKGNREFIIRTNEALNLLKERDYLSYKVIIKNIEVIHQSNKTYFDPFLNNKTAFITLSSDITWHASQILHEAYHSKLYNNAISENRNPIQAYSGYIAEMYCLTQQIECLKQIQSPKYLLEYAISFYDKNWWDKPIKNVRKSKGV
jgi:hypothetical protein